MATRDYLVRMPKDTWVKTACEDIGCESWRHGFLQLADETVPLGRQQAAYIRSGRHGRTFTELSPAGGRALLASLGIAAGDVTVFRFDPGQRCFADHQTRPARLAVRSGGLIRRHATFTDLAEDYTEHIGRLQAAIQKG